MGGNKSAAETEPQEKGVGWEPPAYMDPARLAAEMEALKIADGNQSDGEHDRLVLTV
jgi:hypothetical protein